MGKFGRRLAHLGQVLRMRIATGIRLTILKSVHCSIAPQTP
jgi:hypothetical protein